MHASGIHRDLFKSVYGFCIKKPTKSSILCEESEVRLELHDILKCFTVTDIWLLHVEIYLLLLTRSNLDSKKFNISLPVRSIKVKMRTHPEKEKFDSLHRYQEFMRTNMWSTVKIVTLRRWRRINSMLFVKSFVLRFKEAKNIEKVNYFDDNVICL